MRYPVYVLSEGAFGRAVARHLSQIIPGVTHISLEALMTITPVSPAACVLAAWRPMTSVCEKLDGLAHERRWSFVPVVMDSGRLRTGPVVIPGRSSCWRCWFQRTQQHSHHADAITTITSYYNDNPAAGPQGYLPPTALVAAGSVARILGALASDDEAAGLVWDMDVVTREATSSTAVGIHGCASCGLHRRAEERSVEAMQRALALTELV